NKDDIEYISLQKALKETEGITLKLNQQLTAQDQDQIYVSDPQKETSKTGTIYTTYKITYQGNSVRKRYSKFLALHKKLKKEFPNKILPQFPEKSFLGRFKKDRINERRTKLQYYVQYCASDPDIRKSETFVRFILPEDVFNMKKIKKMGYMGI